MWMSVVASLLLAFSPQTGGDEPCNTDVERHVNWCNEYVVEGEEPILIHTYPSDNLELEAIFEQPVEVRAGCQTDAGELWLETTSDRTGRTQLWHQFNADPSNDNLAFDILTYINVGVGTLDKCQLWGNASGLIDDPLEGILETRKGSFFRFAIQVSKKIADGGNPDPDPGGGGCDATFEDVLDPREECFPETGNIFYGDIEWLAETGITRGCNPPGNTLFCPGDNVTRGQMAAFLVRGLELPARSYDEYATYADVSSTHTFFDEVGILGAEGITRGCNPPDNSRFCPEDSVTRGQMAAFLTRALGLSGGHFSFVDTEGHVFEQDVSALAEAGITRGCNPPANDRFCPDQPVTRGQMAAFLHRALAP